MDLIENLFMHVYTQLIDVIFSLEEMRLQGSYIIIYQL